MFLVDVEHFCATFLDHYISVHFRNLFVTYIAFPVKIDIKKPYQQHIPVRCPENMKVQ